MRASFLGLAVFSVLLSALSQVTLKAGMSSPGIQAAIAGADARKILMAVMQSRAVLLGLLCYGLSAVVWLAVLSRIPLSTAYPFVALGIAITTLAGVLFGESLTLMKLAGVFLIVCGVVAIAADR